MKDKELLQKHAENADPPFSVARPTRKIHSVTVQKLRKTTNILPLVRTTQVHFHGKYHHKKPNLCIVCHANFVNFFINLLFFATVFEHHLIYIKMLFNSRRQQLHEARNSQHSHFHRKL